MQGECRIEDEQELASVRPWEKKEDGDYISGL